MLAKLKADVCEANLDLVKEGLVMLTWGNASAVDRVRGLVVIKPSGLPYRQMHPKRMVVVSLQTGKVVEGNLQPSSDTPTHLELYRAFNDIGGIVHTHSLYATAYAQACREIPAMGTTHADYFFGSIPCTRVMRESEIRTDYEANTGRVIVERFKNLDPLSVPAVLVAGHAPFVWGATVQEAVENSVVLESVARLAQETLYVNAKAKPMPMPLLEKHFYRKHGPTAYYGQK